MTSVIVVTDNSKGRIAQIVRCLEDIRNQQAELQHIRNLLKPEYSIAIVPVSDFFGEHFLKEPKDV